MYLCVHAYMCMYVCLPVGIGDVFVFISENVFVCICIYVYVSEHVCRCMHVYAYAHV